MMLTTYTKKLQYSSPENKQLFFGRLKTNSFIYPVRNLQRSSAGKKKEQIFKSEMD
jgi:hypothetical protein